MTTINLIGENACLLRNGALLLRGRLLGDARRLGALCGRNLGLLRSCGLGLSSPLDRRRGVDDGEDARLGVAGLRPSTFASHVVVIKVYMETEKADI